MTSSLATWLVSVADQLDVLLDRRQLRPLVLNHCPQAVVEGAFDVGDIGLQRTDRGRVLFGLMVMRSSPVLSVVAEAELAAGRYEERTGCDGDERNGCADVLRRARVPGAGSLASNCRRLRCASPPRPDGLRVDGLPASGGAAVGNVPLECAPFARAVSGAAAARRAADWWPQAEGRYRRTQTAAVGSVLVFRRSTRLPDGHVAVVSRVLSDRRILATHANWVRHTR